MLAGTHLIAGLLEYGCVDEGSRRLGCVCIRYDTMRVLHSIISFWLGARSVGFTMPHVTAVTAQPAAQLLELACSRRDRHALPFLSYRWYMQYEISLGLLLLCRERDCRCRANSSSSVDLSEDPLKCSINRNQNVLLF